MTAARLSTPVVTVHLWGTRYRTVPQAIYRMATQRSALRRTHGLRFAKLLGTSSGKTFGLRDADLHHWGILAAWESEPDTRVFELGSVVTVWDRSATERARFLLQPIASRGTWAGQRPFEPVSADTPTGPVASITRARLNPRLWRTFWQSVPPVAETANKAIGRRLGIGIGEAPIGLQGTFSVWDNNLCLRDFFNSPAHARVVEQTQKLGWYSEELFARFAVLSAQGTVNGVPVARDIIR